VAGKAEVDEPLAVESLHHLLQDGDAAGVVLDEIVVGGEDGGNFALGGERRKEKAIALYSRWSCVQDLGSRRSSEKMIVEAWRKEKPVEEIEISLLGMV
jgi:uncharacterized protein YggL (DUF469 family)